MDNKNVKSNEIQKDLFEAPQAEVIVFSTEDVITTSGEEYFGIDGEKDVFGLGDY